MSEPDTRDAAIRNAEAMARDAPEPEHVDPENRCRECGEEAVSFCGCCGAPLCPRHEETQAGFCSDFTTHEFDEGDVVKVRDPILELERQLVVFTEKQEVSGCLLEMGKGEADRFYPMSKLPEGKDEPVSELDQDKIQQWRPGS